MVALTTELLENPEFYDQVKYIIENGDSSSLTATQIRSALESHFGLGKDALKEKPYKKTINVLIDKIYGELQQTQGQNPQEHTPEASDSSREASPTKTLSKKRKAPSPEKETEKLAPKKAKMETDKEEKKEAKSKKASRAKKQSKKIISDSEEEEEDDEDEKKEDEEMKYVSDEDDKKEQDDEKDDREENDSFSPPPAKKRASKNPTKSNAAATKDDGSVKRLKQFINKCGVRKVWSKELADCKSTSAEISKLKSMLQDLGVHGRPTLEKCEAVKKERELKAELDSLDTTLIINETGRRTRSRNTGSSRPTYAVDSSSSEEEEEEEEDEDEGEGEESADENDETKGDDEQESHDQKISRASNDNVKDQNESDNDESSSEDEFKGDESDYDDA
ncbi:hypothetical protein [Parasitella parasitica]|uniref:Histone chaperone domain-containing protein n=1 Tax=Parasitella parasitica TaxID=35722 RepID=A0A0B7MT87_9FUNG|nr:hypothetical protein [Parasitella parasitica]